MKNVRRSFLLLFLLLFLLTLGYFAAFKRGLLPAYPDAFAGLVAALILGLATELTYSFQAVRRGRVRKIAGVARMLLVAGLLTSLSAGMLNWLYSIQGAVILSELEAIPLSHTAHLQEFESGPMSNLDEMRMTLQLEKLILSPGSNDTFTPLSRIRLLRQNEQPVILEVSPRKSDSVGTLIFHQGAFGFAPRIVILRDGQAVFDEVVPFLTQRIRDIGMSFEGNFVVEKEGMSVTGTVTLDSLDEQMRGHATLSLFVTKGDSELGRGELLPGYFADLTGGYRIGFVGLKKWSEIDISRKNYPIPVIIGATLALMGTFLWPIALWRGW